MNQQRQHQQNREDDQSQRRGLSASKWAMLGFLIIAGYFLIMEHRAHVIQFLPFLLVLACVFMHMFHGGHSGHGGHGGGRGSGEEASDKRGLHKH